MESKLSGSMGIIAQGLNKQERIPTLEEQLHARKKELQDDLASIDKLIEAVTVDPTFFDKVESLQQLLRRRLY
jgi:hypothetical protein